MMNAASTATRAPSPPTQTARAEREVTYRGTAPAALVGRTVRAQPFFHRPTEYDNGSAIAVQAEQCHTGCVTEVFGAQMVVVAFEQDAPGDTRQAFYPRELHDPDACACRACIHAATAEPEQAQQEADRAPAQPARTTAHTCNDGQGPYFGRLTDGCPRCEELKDGAAPVQWRRPQETYQPHECTERCAPVCTANDW